MKTTIAIELPEDVARVLRKKWGDLARHTVETLAVEAIGRRCYRKLRSGECSRARNAWGCSESQESIPAIEATKT
jgi:hypothetical protein